MFVAWGLAHSRILFRLRHFNDRLPHSSWVRRVGTTDLYLSSPHLIRHWSMKRGELNCVCAGSRGTPPAKNPSRFIVPTRRTRDEWGSLFRDDPIKIKNPTVWACPFKSKSPLLAKNARNGAAKKNLGRLVEFRPSVRLGGEGRETGPPEMEESNDPKSNTKHSPKRIRTRLRANRSPARSCAGPRPTISNDGPGRTISDGSRRRNCLGP